MFLLPPLFALLLSLSAMASKTALKCLAREEERFHRLKQSGAIYSLNQEIISRMVHLGEIEFTSEHRGEICSSFSPTFVILKKLFLYGQKAFVITGSPNLPSSRAYFASLDQMVEEAPQMLMTYLSRIQQDAPTPDCLQTQAPLVYAFIFRSLHLEEEFDALEYLREKNRAIAIIDQVSDVEKIYERCRSQKAKRESSKLKEVRKDS